MPHVTAREAIAPPRASRVAVAVVFAVNGAAAANVFPRLGELKAELGLTDAALGTALLGSGLGAILGGLAAGLLVARWGSRRVSLASGALLLAGVPLIAVAPGWGGLFLALGVAGVADSIMDVAMNAHGVVVERRYGRPIMNGLHAAWSVGALAGGALGTAAALAGVPLEIHLPAVAVALAVAGAVAATRLLPGDVDRGAGGMRIHLPTPAIGLLGLLVLCAALVEDAPQAWSAVYLSETLRLPAEGAGIGYVAFAAAMLLGRSLGDRVVAAAGPARTTRVGAVLAGAGMAAVLLTSSPVLAVVGFAAMGLGVCTVFPVVFSAAGNLDALPSGAAIAMVSLLARFGFLLGPPLIGALAEVTSLRLALLLVVAAAAVIALASGRVARATASGGDR